jgi:hypothetical protein
MSPDQVHPVIEALCLGLCLAGENGDTEAEEKFNKALLAFTELSYERGRFTRENELMRTDINWLRTQLTNLTERLPK